MFRGVHGRADFFRHALACYDALAADARVASRFPRDLRGWDGDQYALAATIGYREIAAALASLVMILLIAGNSLMRKLSGGVAGF